MFLFFFPINARAQNNRTSLTSERLLNDLFDVDFSDHKNGWACGRRGTILYTQDSGVSWKLQYSNSDFTLSSIFFTDAQHGWAVGELGTILHTENGGKNWIKQNCPVPYYLMDVFFLNKNKGWIVTERTTILYTEDGGRNWKVQYSDRDFILKAVSFSDKLNGWAVGEYGFIYHTSNGGERWIKQAGKFGLSEATGEIIGGNFLFDVVAISPKEAWAVGIDGYIVTTKDAGNNWESVEGNIPNNHLFGISKDDKGNLVVTGEATLLYTYKNKFKTAFVAPEIQYGWLYGSVYTGKSFIAVGKNSWIYISNKKLDSWHKVSDISIR